MSAKPFQFTLRQLFAAVAYFSAATAMIAWMVRWISSPEPPLISGGFILLGPMIAATLLGAGIGELRGGTSRGAIIGLGIGCALYVVGPLLALVIFILLAWLGVVPMGN